MGCFGGSETTIQAAPITPAPSPGESAESLYQARLKYDPLMAQQQMGLQQQYVPQQTALQQAMIQQYAPQLAQLYTQVQQQQMPQLQQLQAQMFPQQAQIIEAGAGQALGALQAPQMGQIQQQAQQQVLGQLQQPQQPLVQAMGQQAMAGLGQQPLEQLAGMEAVAGMTPPALMGTAQEQALAGIQPTGLQQAMTQQAMAGLTPTGLTTEQQESMQAIRARAMEQVQLQARGRAQLGGQLFGGRAELGEQRAIGEMQQAFAAEDVDRMIQQRQLALQTGMQQQAAQMQQQQAGLAGVTGVAGMQEQQRQSALQQLMGAAQLGPGLTAQRVGTAGQVAGLQSQAQQQALQNAMAMQQQAQQAAIPYQQILYPQIGMQQPQVGQFGFQGVTPSADVLYSAMAQAAQPQYFAEQGQPSPLWGLGGAALGAGASVKVAMLCIPEGTIIDTREGQKKVEEVRTGDIVYDKDGGLSKVIMKYEFDETPTNNRFLELTFGDKKVIVCDMHKIDGIRAIDLNVPKRFVNMDKRSYDLLTTGRDGSYCSNGIGIDSMIPELHELTRQFIQMEV